MKPHRHRYFNLIINLALVTVTSEIEFWKMDTISLLELLRISKFVSQKRLETKLYSLEITDRGRLIVLENFDGQLERTSQGIPYWNVYLQTTTLITARCLGIAISKAVLKTKDSIHPTIDINPLDSFQRCERKKLYSISKFHISKSKYDPGYFSKTVLQFEELLSDDLVTEKYPDWKSKKAVIKDKDTKNFSELPKKDLLDTFNGNRDLLNKNEPK
jgi:hypothetical protein